MNIQGYEKLPVSFYLRSDVVQIAQELLGKYVFTNLDGVLVGGKIVETEAYNGGFDKASHASKGRTPRTEVVFKEGGRTYVYLCYGIHKLLNIVTNEVDHPDCVLIRAIEPMVGLEEMKVRRNMNCSKRLTSGPGTLTQALGITLKNNDCSLSGSEIWIASGKTLILGTIVSKKRIGVDYAGEDAMLQWRFYIQGNSYVSVK